MKYILLGKSENNCFLVSCNFLIVKLRANSLIESFNNHIMQNKVEMNLGNSIQCKVDCCRIL